MVILVLASLLTWLGGSVRLPRFETGPDGERRRVFVTDADGTKTPVFEERNKFLNAQNLTQLAKDTSFIAIMAVGMTFVIIAGQIDLSVGSIYALAAVLSALVLHQFGPDGSRATQGVAGAILGTVLCFGTGLLCGLLNGLMIVALRVHPFIITLGTMAIYRGVAFIATRGQSVGVFPAPFRAVLADGRIPGFQFLGLPPLAVGGVSLVPLVLMVVVAATGGVVLSRRVFGRRIYAVGGNELASRFSGIEVGGVKLKVFLVSGLTAGLAAWLSLGYYGSATSGDGQGYELNVIAAAVVGGASLSGGKGTALGALMGALIIQMISSGIIILGIDQNYSQIIVGAVVIVAVLMDQVNTWLARRRMLS